jgi:hypothetical protein
MSNLGTSCQMNDKQIGICINSFIIHLTPLTNAIRNSMDIQFPQETEAIRAELNAIISNEDGSTTSKLQMLIEQYNAIQSADNAINQMNTCVNAQ